METSANGNTVPKQITHQMGQLSITEALQEKKKEEAEMI